LAQADVHRGLAELVERLVLRAGRELRSDVLESLRLAKEKDNTPAANRALEQIVANAALAAREGLPLCQDCGQTTVFADVGSDFSWQGASFSGSIKAGVARAYRSGYFRQSVVVDGLTGRQQLAEESIPVIHSRLVSGSAIKLRVILKGGGSENASRLTMLRPTASRQDITDFVLDTVRSGGASACPPLFVSVAIGGSFDQAPVLSKEGFFRSALLSNPDPEVAEFERELLAAINLLGIGPAGLGGEATAAAVMVTTAPCHMATMPVAVNIGCNCLRTAEGEL